MSRAFNLQFMYDGKFRKYEIIYVGGKSYAMIIKINNTPINRACDMRVYPLIFTKYKFTAFIERFLIRLFN